MDTTPIQLNLSPEMRAHVEKESSRLGFHTPAAYVEAMLREVRRNSARDRAEQLVLEGVASGEPIVADEAFWARFKRELNSRIKLPKTA